MQPEGVMSNPVRKERLAAILAADAAGYSRLMTAAERRTVASLDDARAIFQFELQARRGRVVDMAGDSVFAVFESAAEAVHAALAVQRQLTAHWAPFPPRSACDSASACTWETLSRRPMARCTAPGSMWRLVWRRWPNRAALPSPTRSMG